MDSPSSATPSPTKALNPLSPDRMNQQIGLGSPSMSSDIFNMQRKTPRGLTDVQAKVAYLNNLSRGNSPAQGSQPSAASTAALQRAILGREEAESALANVSAQLSEAQSRERRISERLESLLEELQTTKERQAHERSIFEKEIRKARKEAFRAGSVLVKTQEELKNARNEAKGYKDEAQAERAAKEQAKQEAFERAYAIAGLTEEMEVLKEQLRAAEANNHSQKLEAQAQQKKNDIGRMSLTEGDLNLLLTPTPRRPKRSAEEIANPPQANVAESSPVKDTPPKRQRMSDVTPRKEAAEITTLDVHEEQIAELEETLRRERQLRVDAEGMLEFLRLECHFKRCTCRLAEQKSVPHTHEPQSVDTTKKDELEHPKHHKNDQNALAAPEKPSPSHTPKGEPRYVTSVKEQILMEDPAGEEAAEREVAGDDVDEDVDEIVEEVEEIQDVDDDDDDEPPEEPLITFSPATGTFHTFPSPVRGSPRKANEATANDHQSPAAYAEHGIDARVMSGSPAPKYGSLQRQAPFDSITDREATPKGHPSPAVVDVPWDPVMPIGHEAGTPERHNDPTKVPLRDDGGSNRFSDVPGTPISREEALAQIRARRERANTMKRSVSASESGLRSGGMGVTPVRSARRYPGVQNSDASDGSIRSRRDMSAPIQMSHY
ncbi:hypothetical protein AtubIFM55763_003064 [Aspergillus tubingensis]|uniref:Uncharacterized protein n=2 Tax=Aspergillus subgen. Circumdati TaxID=2720871 RepID=A0A9W6AVC6_ASPTU|nr:similar to An01g13240 [Aspergillus niger]GLA72523.1 hypothetical protein AtubIFM55763_003064 [Aspergillus tubingensis]GLA88608.1 hypothetical protein AtubIFM56815_003066 [Aspergillus tubingensis]GLA98841.1 hypothetical protein AtubIFM57143_007138 [Aspergillus tubingensis]GLB12911.1 hypothetical protein AtubIFM61612_000300 [Aspergillus tubingensis]